MENVLSWIVENWPMILVIVYALVNIGNAISKVTDTEKDNAVFGWLKSMLDKISVLTKSDADGTVKLPLSSSQKKE